MWEMFAGIIIGLFAGLFAGYYFGKASAMKNVDISEKSTLLNSLTNSVLEMKGKFDKYEELRKQKEEHSKKIEEEREKRYKEFMDSTQKFFEKQEGLREKSEERRDKEIGKMAGMIDAFNRTVHGTKTRGLVGEDLLREYLKQSIKAKLVKPHLRTENGEVEFAWNLGDGKYIPIDSKFPEMPEIGDEASQADRKKDRKLVYDKLKKEVENVNKYKNQPNTINKCILVVPELALELCPEIIEYAGNKNVFICPPKQVFLIAYLITEEYARLKEEGEVGEIKQFNKKLISIIKEIAKLTETIERQAKSVLKHNEKILDKTSEALRLK